MSSAVVSTAPSFSWAPRWPTSLCVVDKGNAVPASFFSVESWGGTDFPSNLNLDGVSPSFPSFFRGDWDSPWFLKSSFKEIKGSTVPISSLIKVKTVTIKRLSFSTTCHGRLKTICNGLNLSEENRGGRSEFCCNGLVCCRVSWDGTDFTRLETRDFRLKSWVFGLWSVKNWGGPIIFCSIVSGLLSIVFFVSVVIFASKLEFFEMDESTSFLLLNLSWIFLSWTTNLCTPCACNVEKRPVMPHHIPLKTARIPCQ